MLLFWTGFLLGFQLIFCVSRILRLLTDGRKENGLEIVFYVAWFFSTFIILVLNGGN